MEEKTPWGAENCLLTILQTCKRKGRSHFRLHVFYISDAEAVWSDMSSDYRPDTGDEDLVADTGLPQLFFKQLSAFRGIGMSDDQFIIRIRCLFFEFIDQPGIAGLFPFHLIDWFGTVRHHLQDRVQFHKSSQQGGTFGDSSAALKILHRVNHDIGHGPGQKRGDLFHKLSGFQSLVPHSHSGFDQERLPHSTVFAVDQMELF